MDKNYDDFTGVTGGENDNGINAKDIDEFITNAPQVANNIRTAAERGEKISFTRTMKSALTLLKSIQEYDLQTEAEDIIQTAAANNMQLCQRKIEPFISSFLSLSIEMQLNQIYGQAEPIAKNAPPKKPKETQKQIADKITTATNLIAAGEYNKAFEIFSSTEALAQEPLIFELKMHFHQKNFGMVLELANRLKEKYTPGIENQEPKKIMAVDDKPDMLRTISGMLHEYYKVFSVTSGKEALKILTTKQPDIFILDIEMPGMDGFELAEQIRKMDNFAQTPILFLTSNALRNYVIRAVKSGGNDFIVKPPNRSILLDKISRYLSM